MSEQRVYVSTRTRGPPERPVRAIRSGDDKQNREDKKPSDKLHQTITSTQLQEEIQYLS